MALEPYPELPEERGMSDEGLQVQRGNAMWAKRFEGGTTNLAQRARHAQQIRDYAVSFEDARRQEQANRIATDKDAAKFYIDSLKFDLDERKFEFDMRDTLRKAVAAKNLQPSIIAAKEAATNYQIANTARLTAESQLKDRIATDADLFHAEVAKALLDDPDEGEAYDRAVITAGEKYRMSKRDKDAGTIFETAQKRHTTRTAEAEKAAKAGALGMAPAGITASGATTFDTPPKGGMNPEVRALKAKLGEAEANQATAPPAKQSQYEPGLKALRDKISALESAPASPARWGRDANGKPVRIQ